MLFDTLGKTVRNPKPPSIIAHFDQFVYVVTKEVDGTGWSSQHYLLQKRYLYITQAKNPAFVLVPLVCRYTGHINIIIIANIYNPQCHIVIWGPWCYWSVGLQDTRLVVGCCWSVGIQSTRRFCDPSIWPVGLYTVNSYTMIPMSGSRKNHRS